IEKVATFVKHVDLKLINQEEEEKNIQETETKFNLLLEQSKTESGNINEATSSSRTNDSIKSTIASNPTITAIDGGFSTDEILAALLDIKRSTDKYNALNFVNECHAVG
ncbi:unnamed protein product, partial [Rotaria sp. Silwood2]